jgi:hypothetical protein
LSRKGVYRETKGTPCREHRVIPFHVKVDTNGEHPTGETIADQSFVSGSIVKWYEREKNVL